MVGVPVWLAAAIAVRALIPAVTAASRLALTERQACSKHPRQHHSPAQGRDARRSEAGLTSSDPAASETAYQAWRLQQLPALTLASPFHTRWMTSPLAQAVILLTWAFCSASRLVSYLLRRWKTSLGGACPIGLAPATRLPWTR
jgi:hypothetical protein